MKVKTNSSFDAYQLLPFIRTGDPELRVAHQPFRLNNAADQENPGEMGKSYEKREQLRQLSTHLDAASSELRIGCRQVAMD